MIKLDEQIRRLKILRKVVARKTKINHNQNEWGVHFGAHAPEEKNYCGTAACALGKFALSKEGRELGIKSRWVKVHSVIKDNGGWKLQIGTRNTENFPNEPMRHAAAVFGMAYEEAEELFRGVTGVDQDSIKLHFPQLHRAEDIHRQVALGRIDFMLIAKAEELKRIKAEYARAVTQ